MQRGRNRPLQSGSKMRLYFARRQSHGQGWLRVLAIGSRVRNLPLSYSHRIKMRSTFAQGICLGYKSTNSPKRGTRRAHWRLPAIRYSLAPGEEVDYFLASAFAGAGWPESFLMSFTRLAIAESKFFRPVTCRFAGGITSVNAHNTTWVWGSCLVTRSSSLPDEPPSPFVTCTAPAKSTYRISKTKSASAGAAASSYRPEL